MGDAVIVADKDENFVVFNPAAERMFGVGATDTKIPGLVQAIRGSGNMDRRHCNDNEMTENFDDHGRMVKYSCSMRRVATVHDEYLPCGEGSAVRAEKQNHAGHLLRLRDAPDR